jgi:hypothetical protein
MGITRKEDRIISLNKKYANEYLKITDIVQQNQYFYKALIVENNFSMEIKNVIKEYWECVDLFSISLSDELEERLKEYNFVLEYSDIKIFDIELKENYVTFFLKYPTSKGFLDTYP